MSKGSGQSSQLSSLKRALLAMDDMQRKLEAVERQKKEPIAVIGMGCRFPGKADDPEAFWRLLCDGVDAVTEVPPDRWKVDSYYDADPDKPGKTYMRQAGFLEEVDTFDAQFFGISPREALELDPQQRLLLEVGWKALENAGQAPDKLSGSPTGVFVGVMMDDYSNLTMKSNDLTRIGAYWVTGNNFSFTSGRLSYFLGLQGPSMAVDTACSSSLVAVHLACQSLRTGESNLALAGGVNLILSPELSIALSNFRAISVDGRCKTFDEAADGFGRGEGCGVIVLKRYSDAVSAGDNILALIRGSAITHDGASGGLTVPNGPAQQIMLRNALENSGVQPGEVGYVEAHGTGTSLGDPIELQALGAVLGQERPKDKPLVLGSVKTNFGHLDSAAGVAGLMKVVLSLQHGEIPPHLHFKKLNPHIALDNIPYTIPTKQIPWPSQYEERIAGVSSFGLSGTNAHVVLEAAPAVQPQQQDVERPLHILNLSAKNNDALRQLADRYVNYLSSQPSVSLTDVCYTASAGRSHFDHRLSVLAETSDQLREKLIAYASDPEPTGVQVSQVKALEQPNVVFLFTGQGSQYVGMGRQLYDTQPTFRKALDYCDELLRPHLEQPLLAVLYPDSELSSPINETAYTQPALFALEYALVELWRSWGIEPAAVMGHSVGEYVAACVAGVFSLEDALTLIAERGRLIQELPRNGEMAAVFADENRVAAAIASYRDSISIAAINAPTETVISGAREAIQAVLEDLRSEGIEYRQLKVSHAFHSPLMEPILDAFEQKAREAAFSTPQIGLISNVTGQFVTEGEVSEAGYWRRHIRQPVRCLASMETLRKQGYELFVEVGPLPILSGMGRRCLGDQAVWLPSLRKGREDWQQILESLVELHGHGVDVDWSGFDRDYSRRKLALPTYPFQRKRYWLEGVEPDVQPKTILPQERTQGTMLHPLLGRRLQSPLKEIQFETLLRMDNPAFLADHKVYGAVVLPGTAYVEMVLAAAGVAFKREGYQLEDITIQEALILPEDTNATRAVQLVLTPEGSEKSSFQLVSLTEDGNWKIHARGVVCPGGEDSTSAEDDALLSAARKRCQEQVDVSAYYHRLHDAGLEYGPCFQGISQLWQCDGEALGLVQLPDTLAEDTGDFQLHPVLLDGCFQLSMAALPDAFMETEFSEAVYLPVGLKRLCVHKSFSKQVWAHVSLQPNHAGRKESLEADIRMFDESGQLAAEVTGLYLKRVSRDALKRVMQSDGNEWLYELSWEPEELETETTDRASKQEAGGWIIFADQDGLGKSLCRRLEAQGERCELVVAGVDDSIAADGYRQVNPTDPDDFQRLLQESGEEARLLRGVVYVWGLNSEPGAETEQSQSCGGLLHLVQALAAGNRVESPNLWIVTRGVQPAGTDPELLSVASAPLWGLGGTIASEHPELNCVRLDMDPWPEGDDSEALFKEIWLGSRENQVALRQNQRFVARMQRSRVAQEASGARLELRQDGPFHLDLSSRGLLENLMFRAATRRLPDPGEVEIRVRATGLNFKDILKALGQYQGPDKFLGDECAGTITAVGEGVEGLQIGDEVVALAPGSFSSHVRVRSDLVVPKPDNLSFAEAASLPVVFLTAYYTLHHLAKISAGQRVLVHAAAGGVGLAAVQLAQQVGAEVFATAGSPRKRAFLRTLGIRHVMDSRTLDFADEVMRLTDGRGVDIVLNALAGEFIPKSLSVLAPKGCFLEIGRTGIWDKSKVTEFKPDIDYFTVFLVDTINENPVLLQELLREVMAGIQAGDIKPTPHRVLPIQEAVHAFRFMAQARHIGKIVLSQEDEMLTRSPGTVRSDATYLITGGLGGLGLKVAESLVAQGARNLVLMGRRGASETARGQIQKMEETGARVVVSRADVSQPEQINTVLTDISEAMPPLRGVIHAAGVLDDGLLRGQSWERFDRVMAPKVLGGWNLHALTKDNVLDFFVLFSSTAPLLGAAGQGNYAGANAFLDALAHYRQAQGLPALSINWGPWAEVGMVASAHDRNQRRLKDQGMSLIPPEQGVSLLMRLLKEAATQVAVLPINWAKFAQYHSEIAKRPFFTDLIQDDEISAEAPTEEDVTPKSTGTKGPLLSRRTVESGLREQVAKVLKLPLRKVDVQQPIKDLGLDSLMALELFARIEKLYGAKLPLDTLVDAPTVEQLAKRIANDEEDWSPLVALNTGGSNLPFYCVHGAGGNILIFEELVQHLGLNQPFYGLQSQGLDGEKPILTRIEDMASLYIEEIKAVQPVGPYMLGGYCMGGTVAFEMAQQLSAQGEEVGLLALMETYNWVRIKETSSFNKGYQRLPKIDFLKRKPWLGKLTSKFGRSTPQANGQGEIIAAVQKANEQAAFQYVPKTYPGRICQFLPMKGNQYSRDPELGWDRLSSGGVETITLPGSPDEMLVKPSIGLLADKLKSYIEIVCRDSESRRN